MNQYKDSKHTVRRISMTGMMIAITLLMSYTPLGKFPLPIAEATIAHLPTIIIAILEGPVCGMISGAAMGIISMIHCITLPVSPLDPFIAHPLVSVLPRILIGLTSYYVYAGVSRIMKNNKLSDLVSVIAGAAVGSITNTVGVLGMLYVTQAKTLFDAMVQMELAQTSDGVSTIVIALLVGIVTTNGIAELLVVSVIGTLLVLALKRAGYGRKF